MIEIFIRLILEAPSMYLRQIRQDTYWTIVFNNVPDFFLKKIGITSAFFNSEGKFIRIKYQIIEDIKTNS